MNEISSLLERQLTIEDAPVSYINHVDKQTNNDLGAQQMRVSSELSDLAIRISDNMQTSHVIQHSSVQMFESYLWRLNVSELENLKYTNEAFYKRIRRPEFRVVLDQIYDRDLYQINNTLEVIQYDTSDDFLIGIVLDEDTQFPDFLPKLRKSLDYARQFMFKYEANMTLTFTPVSSDKPYQNFEVYITNCVFHDLTFHEIMNRFEVVKLMYILYVHDFHFVDSNNNWIDPTTGIIGVVE